MTLIETIKRGKVSELRSSLFSTEMNLNESFNHCSVETIKNHVERGEVCKDKSGSSFLASCFLP